jgi:hypothetical protein
VITFYYPDYTVGSGITPDHARFLRYPFPKGEIVTAQRGSWALPPIGNSLALYYCVQVSPCPEGYIRLCWKSLRFDDAVYRANFDALGGIKVTYAFDTGSRVNDVDVAVGDGIGGALGKAGATGNTIFSDFQSHFIYSPCFFFVFELILTYCGLKILDRGGLV